MLNIINEIPKELIDCHIKDIGSILSGPTLLHIKGAKSNPLMISTLLHGNETTSFYVLQKLLADFIKESPKRDVIIFIGNVEAASLGLRQIKDQVDFNRIWRKGDSLEHKMAKQILQYVTSKDPFANIDIHNNTGNNPFYACINKIESSFLQLASLFSKRVVYFTEPSEVESMAFSYFCPSLTIEAGKSGHPDSVDEVYRFIKKVLTLDSIELDSTSKGLAVYHTVARLMVNVDAKLQFKETLDDCDIALVSDIETLNFQTVDPGFEFAKVKNLGDIKVVDNNNNDITDIFFRNHNNTFISTQAFIPSMLTKDIDIIKSDCLGYIMEKILSV